ncbi:carbohydrate ABC transporter substrate-binding protein, CUT1 family [Rhizobium mongolense subsp. loessense]|uniref:Carbohydrate ABC transporter substrate-binding protein, CUT1 family n=2 Tax=Rhizobium TaxID=379 RepID=A0A1C3X4Q5_9HYPH|nr:MULTISPECIES: sugar ABC transporter substrate-binding protein [Rhizobium]NRP90548.1 putative ABC transporter-binding protein [Ensifer adhaerens]SCB47233.1 carbohydrate ABC transporter substrate-binding protein, CUT1 family [Rhizobium multihospitium]SCW84001.1 carbohydrate ABC transporter substrate-binding protein, CUT1 family [Rhizobium mongolense subsp. loessense]
MKKLLCASALSLVFMVATANAETINILVEGGGEMLQKSVAEKFTAETGIKVKFTVVPYQGVFDKFSAEIASGSSAFDVVTIDVVWNAKFAGHVEDLSALFTDAVRADLAPALLADAKVGDKLIGMPAWANAEIVFYRKDLFDKVEEKEAFQAKYGYPLAPPKTWQQWRDIAKFFTRDTDGDGKIDFWGTDTIGTFSEEWMAHVLQAGSPGVILDKDGQVIIDNDAHKKALEFYIAPHCTDHSVPENVNEIGWGEAQNLFYQGKTAMMKFWAHAYKMTPPDSKVSGKVGVVPMLAGDAGIAAVPGPWYNVVPSASQHKDAAKKFIAYAIANNALGIEAPLGLAATNSAYRSYAGKQGYEHFPPLLETLSAPATQGRPLNEKYQEIVDEAVLPALQQALTCKADIGQVLTEAKETIEDILN